MSLTIDELIVAASVDPKGIKVGLDEGVAEINRFSGKAANALTTAQQEVIQKANDMVRASSLLDVQTAAGIKQFRTEANELRSLAEQLGMTEHVTNQLATAEAVVARNRTLAASYLRQLNSETVKQAAAVRDLAAAEATATAATTAETVAIEAQAAAVESARQGIVVGGRDITMRLSSIGVGAAFAFEQMAEGGARGEGALRRVLRSVGILGLAIGGPEGALVAGVALGTAALMDFFNKTEREALKRAEEIRKEIVAMTNGAKIDDIMQKAREVEFGTSAQSDGKGGVKFNAVMGEDARGNVFYENSIRAMQARAASIRQLAEQYKGLGDGYAADVSGLKKYADEYDDLTRRITSATSLLKQLETAAQHIQSQPADNGRLPVDTNAPSPNVKGPKDRGPYADLKDQIGELTTAYESMRKEGLNPTITLQTQLEDAFARTSHMLSQLKDQTGPAANALRSILADMENSGIHSRDNLLPGGTPFTSPVGADADAAKNVDAFIARLKLVREATSEFSNETLGAENQLRHMLDGVNTRIEQEGGVLRASNELLAARAAIIKELAGSGKRDKNLPGFSDADMLTMNVSITQSVRDLRGALKDTNVEWEAMAVAIRGVLDVASGLGLLSQNVNNVARGVGDMIRANKDYQAAGPSKDASGNLQFKDTAAGVLAAVGMVGAGIQIAGSIAKMFGAGDDSEWKAMVQANQEHTKALQQNTAKLDELKESLNPSGAAGSASLATQLSAWLAGFNPAQKVSATTGGLIDDWVRAAQKAGFSVTNSSGQIDLDAMRQFLDYLNQSNAALLTFTHSLSDQESLASLRNLVYGKTGASDTITSTLDILRQFAPKLGAAFDGLDATTAEGREKIKTALQGLFEALASGKLTAEDFGKLSGSKDLAGLITTLAQSLNSMDSAVNAVTGSLTNVPTWYKINLARYLAADASGPADSASRIGPAPSASSGGGAAPGGGIVSMIQGKAAPTINIDRIEVDARQLSPDEIFAAVLAAAQRQAQVQFGDSTEWSQVQAVRT